MLAFRGSDLVCVKYEVPHRYMTCSFSNTHSHSVSFSNTGRIRTLTREPSSFTEERPYLSLLCWTEDPEGAPIEAVKVEKANYFGPIISSWEAAKRAVCWKN